MLRLAVFSLASRRSGGFFAVSVRRLSATAIQDKKDSRLEQQRLFRIDHTVHGKFLIRYGCKRSLCTLSGKQDGPFGLPGSLQKQDPKTTTDSDSSARLTV